MIYWIVLKKWKNLNSKNSNSIAKYKYLTLFKCPKILLCENLDLDLYAISHQLDNLGILYEYIT